ncbi:MAG: hypothetical protein M3O31_14490 [Acidobacteriota bacterium]|nr:hypothetical protein [Acidobacteriota bacterium]
MIRVSPIFLYSPVAISIVGGILVPFLLGARDFDWLLSSIALAFFLTLLLAGLQPYTAKYLVAPRLAWCNAFTSLGVTRELHLKAERDAARERHKAFLRASEAPIILDLAHRGIRVESVWDLHKTPAFYDEAVPVLLEHLRRSYPGEIVQGMIHALTARLQRPYRDGILLRIVHALTVQVLGESRES